MSLQCVKRELRELHKVIKPSKVGLLEIRRDITAKIIDMQLRMQESGAFPVLTAAERQVIKDNVISSFRGK